MIDPEFDSLCRLFTRVTTIVSNWKHNYLGAAYSTRLKAAIKDLKDLIKLMEQSPELKP